MSVMSGNLLLRRRFHQNQDFKRMVLIEKPPDDSLAVELVLGDEDRLAISGFTPHMVRAWNCV
ncbi:hypothetical protein [uncultured Arthrobacter sp.]|uniref:hypothetical protein n=1 Tax=uncultured Arthrobacter sp. TaxID=114050 RepID=UPI0032176E0B